MKSQNRIWTAEERALLTELWLAGDSFSVIASKMALRFGRYYTRNAVAGQRHNMKLPDRPTLTRVAPGKAWVLNAQARALPRRWQPKTPASADWRQMRHATIKQRQAAREALQQRVCEMREAGLGIEAIAERTGLSKRSVIHRCVMGGAYPPGHVPKAAPEKFMAPKPKKPGVRRLRPVLKAEEDEMVRMREAGMRTSHIAKLLGREQTTVQYRLAVRAARDELLGA